MKLVILIVALLVGLTVLLPVPTSASPEVSDSSLKKASLLDFKQKGACAISFCSSSQNIFVAFSAENARKVHRWDLRTGREINSFSAPRGYRCDYTAPSPDGKLLLIATYDLMHDALHEVFKVMLVDTETASVIKVLNYQGCLMTYVQFSRDGVWFRVSPGLPSRYPDWAGEIFDRRGDRAAKPDASKFDLAESTILTLGKGKDRDLYYTVGRNTRKFVKDAFEYLSADDDKLLASSTTTGDVVVWRAEDLKELFRSNFGQHPVFLLFDKKMNRFLVINGNKKENSVLYAIPVASAG